MNFCILESIRHAPLPRFWHALAHAEAARSDRLSDTRAKKDDERIVVAKLMEEGNALEKKFEPANLEDCRENRR